MRNYQTILEALLQEDLLDSGITVSFLGNAAEPLRSKAREFLRESDAATEHLCAAFVAEVIRNGELAKQPAFIRNFILIHCLREIPEAPADVPVRSSQPHSFNGSDAEEGDLDRPTSFGSP